MKKLFFFLGLILLINSKLFAQQQYLPIKIAAKSFINFRNMNDMNLVPGKSYLSMNYGPDKDADFYKRRSKNYRIVGWSTLGAGIVLSGIGLLLANGDYATNNANSNTAGVLTIGGAVSGVVSIPFMIMASVYKHKARAMIENKKTGFGVPPNVGSYITGVTVAISLGN